jgi:hypothetical protein
LRSFQMNFRCSIHSCFANLLVTAQIIINGHESGLERKNLNTSVIDFVAADVRRRTYFPGNFRASSRRLLRSR